MRIGLVIAIFALVGATLLGGAARPAEAAPTGSERALHCTTASSTLITFVAQGSGTVAPASGPRPCGTSVSITATPAANFRFVSWTAFCGTANPCSLFLAESSDHFTYSVGARFERIRRTVTVQRSGSGTVRSEPGGIDCGSTCQADFDQGSQVAFDAIAPPGVQFNGWGGACASAVRNVRCVVTIPAGNITITAAFGPPPVQLTVSKAGNGTITSAPAGINCGGTCTATFPSGSQIRLTATPEHEYPFQGWGGACSGTASTCTLTLTAATSVSARFAAGKVDALAAGFRGTWRRSRYSGELVVRGTATNAIDLTARLSSSSYSQTFTFSVPTGPFNQSVAIPPTGVFPGSYTLVLTGVSGGAPIVQRTSTVRMEPPREGVVSRAWITAGKGKAIARAPRGTKRLVAFFVYAAKPFRGTTVTVSWSLRSRPLGTVKKIRWKPIVTTDVRSAAGLPRGTYTCVLRAGGLVVYQVSVRVG